MLDIASYIVRDIHHVNVIGAASQGTSTTQTNNKLRQHPSLSIQHYERKKGHTVINKEPFK